MNAVTGPDPNPTQTGSPPAGEPVFLAVGRLQRPHGVRGELRLLVLTDFPERLHPGAIVYAGEAHTPLKIRTRRWHNQALLLAFAEYPDRTTAEALTNVTLYVRADDRPPLPDGEYYQHQLLGLQVRTDEGQALGEVTEILETGANDVLVVRAASGKEILLPMTDAVVLAIDLPAGEIRVHLLEGLVE